MGLDDLLLSFGGRIGRGRFLLGVLAVAVVAAGAALIFRVPQGAVCRMQAGTLLGTVYMVAAAVMGLVVLAMLAAVSWKRLADAGWWRGLTAVPVAALAALPFAWRTELLGPCGAITEARAAALAGLGVVFAAGLVVHCLKGSAASRPVPSETAPVQPVATCRDD